MISRRIVFVWLLCACIMASCFTVQAKTAQPYKIEDARVRLFYEQLGTFSENIVDQEFNFWCTLLGQGSAKSPSNSVMMVFKIKGEPGDYEPSRSLHVTVVKKGKVTQENQVEIRELNDKGYYYVPVIIHDTGVFPVTIKAEITGQNANSEYQKTIPFYCGE